jgi:HEAT repeat protein
MVGLLSELAGTSPGPEEVLDLARDLSTPAVASHLVARLASTRSEEEKEHLTGIIGSLGGEVGLALADALGEARDRYQRRNLVDAMVALGPTGQALAEGMLDDSRWYVVRNGVTVLGEVGGEGAVAHLTGTLANPDPRVRKEAVWALAKLGGEDSAMLLLGMLEDGDAEVRSMAARSLGVLRIEKAVRPLLNLLESEEEEDVQIEGLRALGQIGDPGAVPQIEKRAVGGIFSRPTQEIRIAAYRALAGIGTPHAVGLLEKATNDSDSGVRTVAQALLAKRRLLSPGDESDNAPTPEE